MDAKVILRCALRLQYSFIRAPNNLLDDMNDAEIASLILL